MKEFFAVVCALAKRVGKSLESSSFPAFPI